MFCNILKYIPFISFYRFFNSLQNTGSGYARSGKEVERLILAAFCLSASRSSRLTRQTRAHPTNQGEPKLCVRDLLKSHWIAENLYRFYPIAGLTLRNVMHFFIKTSPTNIILQSIFMFKMRKVT